MIVIKDVVYKIVDKIGRGDLIELGAIVFNFREFFLLVVDISCLLKEVGWLLWFDWDRGLN